MFKIQNRKIEERGYTQNTQNNIRRAFDEWNKKKTLSNTNRSLNNTH